MNTNAIIVALDVDNLEDAGSLIEQLHPHVAAFKIGLELLTAVGAPQAMKFVKDRGGLVFFDGKFCDIPNTVARASSQVAKLNPLMFNVHASCGVNAMKAAVDNQGNSLVFAVTVLTSLDKDLCRKIYGKDPKEVVLDMGYQALEAGCDGIICSPEELIMLASEEAISSRMMFMNPGIRLSSSQADDQKRISNPFDAIRNGADYLVIGRPITKSPDPLKTVKEINEEIAKALS